MQHENHAMPGENDATVRSDQWTQARRELLQWICCNETRRRSISNLTEAEIASLAPIVSVALGALGASDTLEVLESLTASIESAESAESVESVESVYPVAAIESAARGICPPTA